MSIKCSNDLSIPFIKKQNRNKEKKSTLQHNTEFWAAPMESFFGQETIAPVCGCSLTTLECNRWRGVGIPFRKCAGRVLYRKSDVVAWLESHELVGSTSEYKKGE